MVLSHFGCGCWLLAQGLTGVHPCFSNFVKLLLSSRNALAFLVFPVLFPLQYFFVYVHVYSSGRKQLEYKKVHLDLVSYMYLQSKNNMVEWLSSI